VRVAAVVLASTIAAGCGGPRATAIAPTVPREKGAAGAGPVAAKIAPVGKMTLRRLPDGMLFVTASAAWHLGEEPPLSFARVVRGETVRDAALETALARAKVTSVEAFEERGGRPVFLCRTADGAQAVFTWTGRSLEPSAFSEKTGPARLAVNPEIRTRATAGKPLVPAHEVGDANPGPRARA